MQLLLLIMPLLPMLLLQPTMLPQPMLLLLLMLLLQPMMQLLPMHPQPTPPTNLRRSTDIRIPGKTGDFFCSVWLIA